MRGFWISGAIALMATSALAAPRPLLPSDIFTREPSIFFTPTLENYGKVFGQLDFARNLLTPVTGRPSAVMGYLDHDLNDLGAGDSLMDGSLDVLSKLPFSALRRQQGYGDHASVA